MINSTGEPVKRACETSDSSAVSSQKRVITGVASADKRHGKGVVSSDKLIGLEMYRHTGLYWSNSLLFCVLLSQMIHTKRHKFFFPVLLCQQGIVIHGFIPRGRIDTYMPHLVAGTIYSLTNSTGLRARLCTGLLNQAWPLHSLGQFGWVSWGSV